MEDLFGGECDMFNAAATAENDEDQPADSRTLLQRVQGGTSCMCCTDVPIATAAVISCSLVDAASSSESPHDGQPGNVEDSSESESVASDHADSVDSSSSNSSCDDDDDDDILSTQAPPQIGLRYSSGDLETPPVELRGMFGAAHRQSAPAAMQHGCGEVDDSRLPSVSAVTGGDNDPSTGAASGVPNADVNAAQSHATRVAARDV